MPWSCRHPLWRACCIGHMQLQHLAVAGICAGLYCPLSGGGFRLLQHLITVLHGGAHAEH